MAGALLVAGVAAPVRPALARDANLTGHWVGKWNGVAFVEYNIIKANRNTLTVRYGYKPDQVHEKFDAITCTATGEYAYNCGASSITFTSTTTADAVLHTSDGQTLTTELTR